MVGDKPESDLTSNSVDVIEWLAKQAGHTLNPEWMAYWRAYCEQPISLDKDK
jgi:hypothetical protein